MMIFVLFCVILVLSYIFLIILLNLDSRISRIERNQSFDTVNIKSPNQQIDLGSKLINGMYDVNKDDEKHLNYLLLSRQAQNGLFKHAQPSDLNTHGDLIPTNLTKTELDTLKLFYNDKTDRINS